MIKKFGKIRILLLSGVFLVSLMVGLAVAAGLQATVTLNNTQFAPGETATADAVLVNDSTSDRVRVDSWVEFVGGTRTTLSSQNLTIQPDTTTTMRFYEHAFTTQDPVGHYLVGTDVYDRKTGALVAGDAKAFMFVIDPDADCVICHPPEPYHKGPDIFDQTKLKETPSDFI